MSKEKSKKTGRRGRRDYVGEQPEEQIEQPEEQIEEATEPGFIKKITNALSKERTTISYPCPECTGITYFKPEDLQKHFEEEHGLILIIEDIEQMKVEQTKKETDQAIKESANTEAEIKEIRGIQDKRILNTLSKPKEMDPKSIVSPLDANTPEDVYRIASDKIANTPDLSMADQETESYYIEEIKGNSIEVSMIKRFPRTQEAIEILNKLKAIME